MLTQLRLKVVGINTCDCRTNSHENGTTSSVAAIRQKKRVPAHHFVKYSFCLHFILSSVEFAFTFKYFKNEA